MVDSMPIRPEVEEAVRLGTRAPSVHNTQPWRWHYRPGTLELHADRTRQLSVIDPEGRMLVLSCGAALELARLGFAAAGLRTDVDRLPDPDRPDLLARIRPHGRTPVDPAVADRIRAARRRYTERLPFRPTPVEPDKVAALLATAADTGVYALALRREDQRQRLADVFAWSDRVESVDPAYREELAAWTRYRDADAPDGVPAAAVPRIPAWRARSADAPVRDFELGVPGDRPVDGLPHERPLYVVVFTTADDEVSRLRAGEAYGRISVEAERLGLASSAMTQGIDLPAARRQLQLLLERPEHPQMVLRLGHPHPGRSRPVTGRRPLPSVLTIED